jgi:hypothetical protein
MTNISKSDTEGKPDRTASVNWTRLKELAEKATPGEWKPFSHSLDGPAWIAYTPVGVDGEDAWPIFSCGDSPAEVEEQIADTMFITELVNALPAILEEVESLRASQSLMEDALVNAWATMHQKVDGMGVEQSLIHARARMDAARLWAATSALTKEQ